jgi:Zn-dependent M28 family amino/carboxypeptidase
VSWTPQAGAPDEVRLRQWVERLAVPRHRHANARNNAWVRDQVATALRNCGFEVQIQGCHRNVVAFPPGAERPLVAVAAHYDGVPHCPGADDNASGLAVMLECARVLAASGRTGSTAFLAFNAEEDQLAGSRDFVANGLKELPWSIRLVHVLEMVGFRSAAAPPEKLPFPWTPACLKVPDFIGLIAKGPSNRAAARAATSSAAPGLHVVAARTWGPLHRWFPDLSRSDHFPFWSEGLPALLWTDTGNFRNPNYHRASDTPDTLDYRFMREVTELLCSEVSEEAAP